MTTLAATWDQSSTNSPVIAILTAVADATGTDPLELPPLANVIDPDALNSLFTSRTTTTLRQVTFQYAGYEVVVDHDGEIRLSQVPDKSSNN